MLLATREARTSTPIAASRGPRAAGARAPILGEALGNRDPFVRLGVDLPHPALHRASLVGATYGLAHRRLGAVSLLGPLRMDYETALRSVRGAARELSRFVERVYADN